MTHKKRNIPRWVFPTLTVICMLCTCIIPALAATIESYDNFDYEMVAIEDGYHIAIALDGTSQYWERYRDDTVRFTYVGSSISGSSQSRLIDNMKFNIYPLGKDVWLEWSGIRPDAQFNSRIEFEFSMFDTSAPNIEDFTITVGTTIIVKYSDGSTMSFPGNNTSIVLQAGNTAALFDCSTSLSDYDVTGTPVAFCLRTIALFSGIDDEDNNTSVSFTASHDCGIEFDVSQSAGDLIIANKTNNTLRDILYGSSDQQGAADDFNQDIDDNVPGIQDDIDELDKVTRPTVDDVETDMEDLVGADGAEGTNNILAALVGYPLVASQFIIVVTMMLLGYVLYGKRG